MRSTNLFPMLQVGVQNIELVRYLVNQLRQTPEERHAALQEFMPTAQPEDWSLSVAGQRVQIIKSSKQGAIAARHGGRGLRRWLPGRAVGGITRRQHGGDDHVGGA